MEVAIEKKYEQEIKKFTIKYQYVIPHLECFDFLVEKGLAELSTDELGYFMGDLKVKINNFKANISEDLIKSLYKNLCNVINDAIERLDIDDSFYNGLWFSLSFKNKTRYEFNISISKIADNIIRFDVHNIKNENKNKVNITEFCLQCINSCLYSEYIELSGLLGQEIDNHTIFDLIIDFDNYNQNNLIDIPKNICKKMLDRNKNWSTYMSNFDNLLDTQHNSVPTRIDNIINNINTINESELNNESFLIKLIKRIGNNEEKLKELTFKIKTLTEKVCVELVKQNYEIIQYINNPSEEVKIAAVKKDGNAIKYIVNPSEELQVAAVKNSYAGEAIRLIDNPTEAAKLAAVKKHGIAIQYIKHPSEELQLCAIKNNLGQDVFKYINNPSEKVKLAAVKKNGNAIKYIVNPSEELQICAVKNSICGDTISYINNPSEKVKLAAVKKNGNAIKYIVNPSEEVQVAAVKESYAGEAIRLIDNPTEAAKLAAVKNHGSAIEYIKHPSEKVQLAAVKTTHWAIQYIKKPSEEVKNAAKEAKSKANKLL